MLQGAHRLEKLGVLVCKLQAVENLGAVSAIMTDSRGVLTEGTLAVAPRPAFPPPPHAHTSARDGLVQTN